MSFSCPHFVPETERCQRLDADCVPGRPGCVLGGQAVFAVPVEERIRAKEEQRRRERAGLPTWPPAGQDGVKR